jgi:hypothetical protein
MALDSQFLALMPDRVQIQHFTSMSTDGYGVRTYGTASTFQCRIEQHVQLMKDTQHKDVVSTTRIYMPTTTLNGTTHFVSVSDRVVLNSTYDETGIHLSPPIIWVERQNDDKGAHHQVVWI